MKDFWNQRYKQTDYVYGEEPNAYFKQCLAQIPTGHILLPAEGEGRNAIYAARQGWKVTAFDSSEEGQKKAFRLAAKYGVEIEYLLVDAEEFSWDGPLFDCIALIYAHQPASKRKALHQQLLHFLKPEGSVIVEAFSKAQLGKSSGGPQQLDMLYSREELQGDFGSLRHLNIQEVETQLQEGAYHVGEASVIRCFGKK